MRLLLTTILILFFTYSLCLGQDSDEVNGFLKKAEYEFKYLLSKAPDELKNKWSDKNQKHVQRYISKGNLLQEVKDILISQGDYSSGSFSYSYLNEIHELELTGITALVNGLGKDLFDQKIKLETASLEESIDRKFEELEEITGNNKLPELFRQYLSAKRDLVFLSKKIPVKLSFVFEPTSNAYSETPEKVIEFEIKDWLGTFSKIEEIGSRLSVINDELIIEKTLIPKDPLFTITLAVQISVLLASIPGYILTFTEKKPVLLISAVVAVSMLLSFVLIFTNTNTWLNILFQSLVPIIFTCYWLVSKNQSNKLINRTENASLLN